MSRNYPFIRNKYIWNEINIPNIDENARLLSVSQYTGIKPKSELIKDGDFLSRANSLIGYKAVQKGDLVINTMLAWNGSLGISEYDGVVSPAYNVYRLINKELWDSDFLHFYLRSENSKVVYLRYSTGIIQSRLRLYPEQFLSLSTPKIPIELQKQIGKVLKEKENQIEILKDKLFNKVSLYKQYYSSLVSKVITKGLDQNKKMKDSKINWIGNVPAHWNIKPLKYITKNYSGGTPSKDNEDFWTDGTIPWVSAKDMKTFFIDQTQDYITEEAIMGSATKLVPPYSILVVVRSGILKKTVPVAVNRIPVTINQDIKVYEIISNEIDSEFLANYLVGKEKDILFNANSLGATVDSLDSELLGKFPIVIPTMEEQLKINEYIRNKRENTEKLIDKINQEIQKLEEYRTHLITAAVSAQIDVLKKLIISIDDLFKFS